MSFSLPYNSTVTNDLFTPLPFDQDQDGTPGFWVILQGSSLVVAAGTERWQLPGTVPEGVAAEYGGLMIGIWLARPLRALRIPIDAVIPAGYEAIPFQGTDNRLDDTLVTIAGRAAQILHWERRSRFCSHCGSGLSRIAVSWGKHCPTCGDDHFPHIHPCIIVLVRRDDQLLMIRNASWSAGRFSLVAGFLDFGESLEECVKREVREEAGIEVKNIRYAGSQCWPFPSQLMVGFLADYAGGEVAPDGVEVAEAGWFHKDALPLSPGGRRSISRWLVETFGNTYRK